MTAAVRGGERTGLAAGPRKSLAVGRNFKLALGVAMAIASSAKIHPSAVIDPRAEIGEEVEIGPFVVIEGEVRVGTGSILHAGVHLFGPMTLGCHNVVHSHAVLGGEPQHMQYRGEPTRLEIGNHNILREHVTIHRGTTASWVTRLGDHNLLMAGSHIGHDCVVGNHCLIANNALLGGHVVIGDRVYLSGSSALHQFVHVGRLALLSGLSGASKDIPPFIMMQRINCVVGINTIGMRRAGIPSASIDAVREAFHIIYRLRLTVPQSMARLRNEFSDVPEVMELVDFISSSTRGITLNTDRAAA
jgi:UDP-N-acetylglucosamine acyltransferase